MTTKLDAGTCRFNNIKCVRKQCGADRNCLNRHCPLLHHWQWDDKNPEWTAETGPLPQRKGKQQNVADVYRPGGGG